jgi:LysR family transcriptional regulator of gallate degradation
LILRQFEYFISVADAGSFTAAATKLGVAQPTLTKSIHALETELQVKLFERLPRGIALTPFGAALRRHAERVGLQVLDAVREIDTLRSGVHGSVAIGAGPSWLRRLLPEAVAGVITSDRSIHVSVQGGYDDMLLRDLRSGSLDFVVAELPWPENAGDLELTQLSADTLGVCCRSGHPLEGREHLSVRDLLDFPWIMPLRSSRARQRLNGLFAASDLPPPRVAVETESQSFLLQILAQSDALSFTMATTVALPEAGGITMLDVPTLSVIRKAGIVSRRDGWLSPAARAIIDALKAICARESRN